MLLRVIALDYDGTIAEDGVLHPEVREAIAEARQAGLFVVIVTGRILRELRRVAGDLSFVDGVVAENGAVILLANGHRRLLGPPPFPVFLSELSERGIEFVVGRCLIDLDAEHSQSVLSIIREKNLPLMISFNRNRMMVLPHSISKATGLSAILDILGTSVHNTLGIGDAENDFELLKGCEYGVTVEWAPEFLKNEADFVLPGKDLAAVARYIRHAAAENRIPTGVTRHRKLVLESKKGEPSFEITIRGRNILIAGGTKSGKSWIAGLFCEQLILQRYTMIIIDPEGDYSSLAPLPNTLMLGGGRQLPTIEDLVSVFQQGLSIILNLSHLDHQDKVSYVCELLPVAAKYRRIWGYPHSILLDECHYFLRGSECETILDPELGSYTLVTYHPSELPRTVLQSFEAVIATRIADKEEVDAIRSISKSEGADNWYELLRNLVIGEAVLLPPTLEAMDSPRQFSIVPRLTLHVRHRTKYFDRRMSAEQAFVYTDNGRPTGRSAATLSELAGSATQEKEQVIYDHLRRHDFSQWIANAFDDIILADEVRKIESLHYHDRTAALFGEDLSAAIKERYDHDFQPT